MKKIFLIFAFILITSFTVSDFCQGYTDGFCSGFRDIKGDFVVCPVAPVCPVPDVGKDNYRGGYNEGFKKGQSVAKE